ncbi:MAG: hypothetical protein DMG70_25725 [Acidobacteria bacterium]|nr:MAG: hypothetical protein DMG70_25725 [Acidobacteriota bacterium]
MIVRHVENPERQPVRESYHLVTMSQTLERAGDHAKNLARRDLPSGHRTQHAPCAARVRLVLRAGFVDRLRRAIAPKNLKAPGGDYPGFCPSRHSQFAGWMLAFHISQPGSARNCAVCDLSERPASAAQGHRGIRPFCGR